LVRQLAPDSSPIEIETMSGQKDQAASRDGLEDSECSSGHPAGSRARIAADLNSRSGKHVNDARAGTLAAAALGQFVALKKIPARLAHSPPSVARDLPLSGIWGNYLRSSS
jgi:hypothetical protein